MCPLLRYATCSNSRKFPVVLAIVGHNDRYTAVCSLVISQFRRLLRQEGAFLHQDSSQGKPVTWWIDELLVQVTRQAHLQLRLDRYSPPTSKACSLDHSNSCLAGTAPITLQALHQAPLQLVLLQRLEQGDTIAKVDINSDFAAPLVATEATHPHLECNCKIVVYKCDCGNFHTRMDALSRVGPGEILTANTDTANTTIVQFDGSAHRTEGVGGAGAALLRVGPRGFHLLRWGSLSLHPCKDNIVAEAYGAELAMILYSEYVKNCRKERCLPLSLSTIQGDIKPLIHHLQFAGRFRRSDHGRGSGQIPQAHRDGWEDLEYKTRSHKTARLVQRQGLSMPLVAPAWGVGNTPWAIEFAKVAKLANGPLDSLHNVPLLAAPTEDGEWTNRSTSTLEAKRWLLCVLKKALRKDPDATTIHCPKSTALSWAGKAGLGTEVRQVLGHHSTGKKSHEIYNLG